jgi:histone chaperone ASF1
MSAVNILDVKVLDNPAAYTNPLQFEIEYECLQELKDDLEWKMVYVGSADSEKYDQVLDTVLVGPVLPGNFRFVFQAEAPDSSKIPPEDIIGVTIILLTCSYNGREFVRVGYYVNNEYQIQELRETPPETPQIENISRQILADHPRVTKFAVPFDDDEAAASAAMEGVAAAEAMGDDTIASDGWIADDDHDDDHDDDDHMNEMPGVQEAAAMQEVAPMES